MRIIKINGLGQVGVKCSIYSSLECHPRAGDKDSLLRRNCKGKSRVGLATTLSSHLLWIWLGCRGPESVEAASEVWCSPLERYCRAFCWQWLRSHWLSDLICLLPSLPPGPPRVHGGLRKVQKGSLISAPAAATVLRPTSQAQTIAVLFSSQPPISPPSDPLLPRRTTSPC